MMLLSGGARRLRQRRRLQQLDEVSVRIAHDHAARVVRAEGQRRSTRSHHGNTGSLERRERLVDVANDEHERHAARILRTRIHRLPLDVFRLDHLDAEVRARHSRDHPAKLRRRNAEHVADGRIGAERSWARRLRGRNREPEQIAVELNGLVQVRDDRAVVAGADCNFAGRCGARYAGCALR